MRRHPLPDNEIAASDAADELQRAFALLLPIRRQRLRRAERQQHDAERALHEAENQYVETTQLLDNAMHNYQQLRESFAEHHQAGLQKQERLVAGLKQEREAGESVSVQRNQLTLDRQEEVARQQQLHEAQQQTQVRQRDVEKLEYLIEQSEALK